MPSLYNSVGDLRFYNFISNQYFSGVPVGSVFTFVPSTGHLWGWADGTAFNSTTEILFDTASSSWNYYWYFPAVAGTPTANEQITGNRATNNYRFRYRNNSSTTTEVNDRRVIQRVNTRSNSSQPFAFINTQTGLSTASVIQSSAFSNSETNSTSYNTDSFLNNRFDWFSFAVKTPTTLVMTSISVSQSIGGSLKDHYSAAYTAIWGWAHDSIYANAPAAPETASLRYNPCYFMFIGTTNGSTSTSYSSYDSFRPIQVGLTTQQTLAPRYYDITCAEYSNQPLFLSDLILCDNTTPFRQVGKIDNRAICMGRGAFELGKIYRATDIFGRSGTEDWLCVHCYTPSSYTPATWTPSSVLDARHYKVWQPGFRDYMLQRIYTEAD